MHVGDGLGRTVGALGGAFATPGLRRLQLAGAACAVGHWAFFVVLAIYAFQRGGATAVGVAAVARMLPAAVAAPFAGVLVDRFSRRDVILAATAARAVVLGAIAAAVGVGAGFGAVLALAALFTVLESAHRPAQAALLPALADTPVQLTAANAVAHSLDNGGFLVGSLLAGALVSATSAETAFALSAGVLATAAVLVARIPADSVPEHRGRTDAGAVHEARAGLRAVAANRRLRGTVGVLSVATLLEGVIDVLVVVSAIELVGLGRAGPGWLNAAWGLGGLLGGAAALALLGRRGHAAGLALGGTLAGLPLLGVAALPEPAVALGAWVVVGVGYAVLEVAGMALLQRLSADDVLGRVFSTWECAYQLVTGLGAILAPLVLAVLGTRGALVAVGITLPLVLVLRSRALATWERAVPVPEREFGLLRALPLFAPLPLATLESLAQRVVPVPAPSGRTVIRQGDDGDRFFLVADGRFAVVQDGVWCRDAGAGDFFGEIALLRDVPRTATVTAATDSLLFALDRETFLTAVTGHAHAAETAHRIARTRLGEPEPA